MPENKFYAYVAFSFVCRVTMTTDKKPAINVEWAEEVYSGSCVQQYRQFTVELHQPC